VTIARLRVLPYILLLVWAVLPGCHRAAETPEREAIEAAPPRDRVCVVSGAHLYADPGLSNPLSPRMLDYWDFVSYVGTGGEGQAEQILVGGDSWWVSTAEVRPVYRITEECELTLPLADSPGGDEGGIGHTGLLTYLAPGDLVALCPPPQNSPDGYLLVQTYEDQTGLVSVDSVSPVGDPGK